MSMPRTTCDAVREVYNRSIPIHATVLALAETGLGTTLRSLHIPLSGSFLSLNQIFLLTHCLISLPKRRTSLPFSLSTSAAAFSFLFPHEKIFFSSGAICFQGLLYNIGILLFGNTLWGRLLGGVLASMWGIVQPFVLFSLIFGAIASSSALSTMQNVFVWLLGLKAILAIVVVISAHIIPSGTCEKYFVFLAQRCSQAPSDHPIVGAFFDLCKPLFLLSLGITAFSSIYLYGWCLRSFFSAFFPLIFGFTMYLLLRLIPAEAFLRRRSGLVGEIVRTMQTM